MGLLNPNIRYSTGAMVSPTRNLQATLGGLGDQLGDYRKEQLTKDAMQQRLDIANLPYEKQAEERTKEAAVMANVPKNLQYSATGTTGLDDKISKGIQSEYGDLLGKSSGSKKEDVRLKALGDEINTQLSKVDENTVVSSKEYGQRIFDEALANNLGSDAATKMATNAMALYGSGSAKGNEKSLDAQSKANKAIYDAKISSLKEKYKIGGTGKASGSGSSQVKDATSLMKFIDKDLPNTDYWGGDLGGIDLKDTAVKLIDEGYSPKEIEFAISAVSEGENDAFWSKDVEAPKDKMFSVLAKIHNNPAMQKKYLGSGASGPKSISLNQYNKEFTEAENQYKAGAKQILSQYGGGISQQTEQKYSDDALSKILSAGGKKFTKDKVSDKSSTSDTKVKKTKVQTQEDIIPKPIKEIVTTGLSTAESTEYKKLKDKQDKFSFGPFDGTPQRDIDRMEELKNKAESAVKKQTKDKYPNTKLGKLKKQLDEGMDNNLSKQALDKIMAQIRKEATKK